MAINFRGKISEYSSSVLGVIKEKYRLKDKSEALDKLISIYGEEFVEKEVNEKTIKNLISTCETHHKKHGYKKMSIEELDKLCEVDNV